MKTNLQATTLITTVALAVALSASVYAASNGEQADSTKKKIAGVFKMAEGEAPASTAAFDFERAGDEYLHVWDFIGRKDIAELIATVDSQASLEFKNNHLDRALMREEQGLACAASFARGILNGPDHASIPTDGTDVDNDGPRPLYWLTTFRSLDIEPDKYGDGRTLFKPDKYIGAIANYAHYLSLKGGQEKAIAILRRAIFVDPDCSAVHLYLGDALWDKGAKAEAEQQYKLYLACARKMKVQNIETRASLRSKGQAKGQEK